MNESLSFFLTLSESVEKKQHEHTNGGQNNTNSKVEEIHPMDFKSQSFKNQDTEVALS